MNKDRLPENCSQLLRFYEDTDSGRQSLLASKDGTDEPWAWDVFGKEPPSTDLQKIWKTVQEVFFSIFQSETKEISFKTEEMRTILGSHLDVGDYIPGDNLSENVYACVRQYLNNSKKFDDIIKEKNTLAMRYGHSLRLIGTQHTNIIKKIKELIKQRADEITPGAGTAWKAELPAESKMLFEQAITDQELQQKSKPQALKQKSTPTRKKKKLKKNNNEANDNKKKEPIISSALDIINFYTKMLGIDFFTHIIKNDNDAPAPLGVEPKRPSA